MATAAHYTARAKEHARNALAAIKCHDVAASMGLHHMAAAHARHARKEADAMRKANRHAAAIVTRCEESALRRAFIR